MKSQILGQFGLIPPNVYLFILKQSPNANTQTNVPQQHFFFPSILVRILLFPMPCLEAALSISHYNNKWEDLPRWSTTWNCPLPKELSSYQHYLPTHLANPAHPSPPYREGCSHGSPDPLGWFLQRQHHALWGSLLGKLQGRQGLACAKRIKVPKRRGELW